MLKDILNKVLTGKITQDKEEIKKIVEVLFLTQQFLDEYNLSDVEIKIHQSKHFLGLCINNGETISLQLNHILTGSKEAITETIIHEIAHCLTTEEGHNVFWQTKALEMGLSYEHIQRYKNL